MKILLVPDVHGSHHWEKAKEKLDLVDMIIFLGDYVDSGIYDRKIKMFRNNNKWPDQGENLRNILDFRRAHPDKVRTVWGNHDWQYVSAGGRNSICSGHQAEHALEIKSILLSNLDILDIAVECDGWVFSHAGFSKTWVDSYLKREIHNILDKQPFSVWDEKEFGIEFLNNLSKGMTHTYGDDTCHPQFDSLLDWHGYFSGSGDEKTQGPLWIRHESLLSDMYYPKQVVGHTEMCMGEPVRLSSKLGNLMVLDSSGHDMLYEFDTESPGDFVTLIDYNRTQKQILKGINTILSMKIQDDDAIENELLNVGVKKENLPAYVSLVKEY